MSQQQQGDKREEGRQALFAMLTLFKNMSTELAQTRQALVQTNELLAANLQALQQQTAVNVALLEQLDGQPRPQGPAPETPRVTPQHPQAQPAFDPLSAMGQEVVQGFMGAFSDMFGGEEPQRQRRRR